MNQTINQAKLKASAEHLERTLNQYPDSEEVRDLLDALTPLIKDAESGQILDPIDRQGIPRAYDFADGTFRDYKSPDIEEAYFNFSAELRGGRSEDENLVIAKIKDMMSGETHHE